MYLGLVKISLTMFSGTNTQVDVNRITFLIILQSYEFWFKKTHTHV